MSITAAQPPVADSVLVTTPAQATGTESLVPSPGVLLAALLTFATFAAAARSVDWLASTKVDRILLGIAYAIGVGGFVFTGEIQLLLGPPAATLPWIIVGRFVDAADGSVQQRTVERSGGGTPTSSGDGGGGGSAGEDGGSDSDTALDPATLTTEAPGHDFSDVGGMGELKETLHDRVIDPLTRGDVYDHYGIGAVNGVLFYGPPGCGKTFVASALASETDYNYLEVSPADLTSKYIGEAADNVAAAFEAARENEPCLLFLDEIDAVAGDREGRMATSEQQMVNQLLTELESQAEADVVVFAATNYLDDVDDAILRSGRFDERVEVPPPDRTARREILELALADAPTAADLAVDPVAEATAGYASSDVELVAQVAIRHAIGDESPVEQAHLQQAVQETETSIPGWLDRYDDRFEEDLVRGPDDDPVPFRELPGMDEVTEMLERRVLEPVRNGDRYERHDVAPVHGTLLYGPPDAGKTTLARSLAAELDRPVLEISPDRFRREGTTDLADRAAEIVEDAREAAPSVLVLDDIEELAPATGGSRQHRAVASRLAALLPTLVDEQVLVVGTAGDVGAIDVDVLHAGTFDERIEVPPPTPQTRAEILADALPTGSIADCVDVDTVGEATEGFSIRDVRHLAGRVGREALRRDEQVTTERLLAEAEAIEATLAGWESKRAGGWDETPFEGLPADALSERFGGRSDGAARGSGDE